MKQTRAGPSSPALPLRFSAPPLPSLACSLALLPSSRSILGSASFCSTIALAPFTQTLRTPHHRPSLSVLLLASPACPPFAHFASASDRSEQVSHTLISNLFSSRLARDCLYPTVCVWQCVAVEIDRRTCQARAKRTRAKKNCKKEFPKALHGFEPWFQESESCVLTAAL